MKLSSLALSLFVLEGLLPAQHLDFGFGVGVKGGVPFIPLAEAGVGLVGSLSEKDNYIIGPVVEMRLPFGFAIEADGLYRGTSYQVTNGTGGFVTIDSSSWEIPYLAKFRFPIPLLKPFVVAGGSYRTLSNLQPGITPTHNAFVAGLGLELRIKRLRLSAEARYLRWGEPPDTDVARLKQSQGEVLFGVIF
jgi:hypothetical protein